MEDNPYRAPLHAAAASDDEKRSSRPRVAETVTVEVGPRLVWLARSRLLWIVAALTGVSVSFAPLFLYYLGQQGASIVDPRVLICFAIVYLVPSYYMVYGSLVIFRLRQVSRS